MRAGIPILLRHAHTSILRWRTLYNVFSTSAAVVENNVVKSLFVEDKVPEVTVTSAAEVLKTLFSTTAANRLERVFPRRPEASNPSPSELINSPVVGSVTHANCEQKVGFTSRVRDEVDLAVCTALERLLPGVDDKDVVDGNNIDVRDALADEVVVARNVSGDLGRARSFTKQSDTAPRRDSGVGDAHE